MEDIALSRIDEDIQENAEAEDTIQLCIFALSDKLFGISIFDVQEILENAEITPIPTTPHFLRGVINLRGNIVPIVDIREVLNLPIKERTRESRIMILQHSVLQIGILVDAITEVTRIRKRLVHVDVSNMGISDGKFISNIVQYRDGFLVLFNLDYLQQAIQL